MRPARRSAMLVGAALLLTALVIADQAGLFASGGAGGAGGAGAGGGARAPYIEQAALTAQTSALVEQGPQWAQLRETLEAERDGAMRRMIVAPSGELAAARLRGMVESAMSELGLRLTSSAAIRPDTPLEGSPLRVIGLTLDFDAVDPDAVFALVERLENLPDARTTINSISLSGPMRMGREGLTVSMELRALSMVVQDG